MYTDTTRVQVVKAVGVWLLVIGLAGLALTGAEFTIRTTPVFAITALAATVVGATLVWGSRSRLRAIDAANRPFLTGPDGASVMHARADLERHIVVAARWILAVFVVLAIAFVTLLSAASCGDSVEGFCGDVGRPSDAVMITAQTATLVVGAAWAVAVALRRTHAAESERIDQVVAEGQRARRHDHPLSDMDRRSWE